MGFFHKARNVGALIASSAVLTTALTVGDIAKPAPSSAAPSADLPALSPRLEKALVAEKADSKQALGLADMTHRGHGTSGLMADAGTIGSLAAHDYKVLFIEAPYSTQRLINDFASQKIDREDFINGMTKAQVLQFQSTPKDIRQEHENTAAMIGKATAQGIQVCAVDFDTTLSDPQSPILQDYRNKAYTAWQESGAETSDKLKDMESDAFSCFEKTYYDGMPRRDRLIRDKELVTERLQQDREIAKTMKNIAGDRKFAIYYGGAHMPGFQKELGADNMALARLEPEGPGAKEATVRGVSSPTLGTPGFSCPGSS